MCMWRCPYSLIMWEVNNYSDLSHLSIVAWTNLPPLYANLCIVGQAQKVKLVWQIKDNVVSVPDKETTDNDANLL